MAIIIGYFPALHQGYINFFAEHSGEIYVLGKNLVQETPRLERDLRALNPEVVAAMIRSLKRTSEVSVLRNTSQIEAISSESVVMPDEDVSRDFAITYLAGVNVTFVPTFLRWDRNITTREFEVPADRNVSVVQLDQELLAIAELEAAKSPDWWRQVGVVVARDGKPLISTHNRPSKSDLLNVNIFGDPRSNFDAGENIELTTAVHGEAAAIAEAAKKGIALEGTSLYVTTFPCPVCAKSVAAAGIKRVYYSKGYSLVDAEDILRAANVELIIVETK